MLETSAVIEVVPRGLIEREPSMTDGRVARLRLTAEGERRLAEAFTKHEIARAQFRRAISDLDTRDAER